MRVRVRAGAAAPSVNLGRSAAGTASWKPLARPGLYAPTRPAMKAAV